MALMSATSSYRKSRVRCEKNGQRAQTFRTHLWFDRICPVQERLIVRASLIVLPGLICTCLAIGQSREYFTIRVVDEQTGRGVPLVELKTTNEVSYYTDSNGIVAFFEPGLMDQAVHFTIRSDGYEFPEDSFGIRGAALHVARGGSAVLKVHRTSIAERLYRLTGEGIYRDSVLVGAQVPIKNPVLNGQVMGQDGGLAIPWRGKIFWFWGDTARPSYPLGNFGTTGGTSEWPSKGGLDPNVGVDLHYFVDETGFTRPMLPSENFPGPGPRWMGGLKIVDDGDGRERLVADYMRVDQTMARYESGIAIWNDKTDTFERLVQFGAQDTMVPACTGGQVTRVRLPVKGDYDYQGTVPPLCRVRADLAHVKDLSGYEGFSPLLAGTRYAKDGSTLDRDGQGRLRFGWKAGTPPLTAAQERDLIAAGKMTASEGFFQLRSVDSDKTVLPGPGSVEWNAFRRRWVTIVKEDEGIANHGTLWFAEADTPLGPWVYAKQILRHEYYNFYNPIQHAFFDEDNGRSIFFEGTYADSFDAGGPITPRYNYNEILYRLDLGDPRLALPVPIYLVGPDRSTAGYLLGDELNARNAWDGVLSVPFFAIPPGYNHDGLIPIFASVGNHGTVLSSQPSSQADGVKPRFYALPVTPSAPPHQQGLAGKWACKAQMAGDSDYASLTLDLRLEGERVRSAGDPEEVRGTFRNGDLRLALKTDDGSYAVTGEQKADKISGTWQSQTDTTLHGTLQCQRSPLKPPAESPAIVPLYEYVNVSDGSCLYSTDPNLTDKQLRRSAQPLCRVWRNPLSRLFLDPTAKPLPFSPPKSLQSSEKTRN